MAVFLLSQNYFIFGTVLLVALFLAVIELVSLLCNQQSLGLFEPVANHKIPAPIVPQTIVLWLNLHLASRFLWGWVWLLSFGMFGLLIQCIYFTITGSFVPHLTLYPLVGAVSIVITRFMIPTIASRLPFPEQTPNTDSFIGFVADVKRHSEFLTDAVEAELVDHNNKKQLIKVIALEKSERFMEGDKVILINKVNNLWQATRLKRDIRGRIAGTTKLAR